MRSILLLVIALCFFMILSSCNGAQVRRDTEAWAQRESLDLWLEDTLIPYLSQQLSQHPRFKGQPVLLVRMKADDVQAQIDDLTNHIRDQIMDALLKEPGLDLTWRPTNRPWKHHQSLENLSCGMRRKINYYIGIDSGLTKLDRKLYVKVRALNLSEKKWIAGFGRSWQGKATAAQLAALGREHPDEYLRGLRPLPFSSQQPDMLAAYLANNLSCLLQQGEADNLVIYVNKASTSTPKIFQTTLDLTGKYLARFREVEVTDDSNQANVTLVSEIHLINQGLYQIWVSARLRQGQKYLPGAETEAYVLMSSQASTPAIIQSSDQLVKHKIPSGPVRATPALIASFALLTPLNQAHCATNTPWIAGERQLQSYDHIPSDSCLAVEMNLSRAAFVFLLSQDPNGELTRLYPSECPSLKKMDTLLEAQRQFRFPSIFGSGDGILALDGSPGLERIYAIAITSPEVADEFAYHIKAIQGLCRPGQGFVNTSFISPSRRPHEQIRRWHEYLNQVYRQYPEMVQWREIRFWHDPL